MSIRVMRVRSYEDLINRRDHENKAKQSQFCWIPHHVRNDRETQSFSACSAFSVVNAIYIRKMGIFGLGVVIWGRIG